MNLKFCGLKQQKTNISSKLTSCAHVLLFMGCYDELEDCYVVFDSVVGNFHSELEKRGDSFSWKKLCRNLAEIASAMSEVGLMKIVHRDLAARNVYYLRSDQVKLVHSSLL